MSKLRDWGGLPDGLLHSIVELLGSFPDLLAFAATCHPWRSAFSSYPSKSTLYALFPPLLLNPNVPFCSHRPLPNVARNTSVPKRPCYVIDLGSQDTLLCSQIPLHSFDYGNNGPSSALQDFAFMGASFGHMIFCSDRTCFLFDVFTGIEVSPPLLPVDENTDIYCHVATLTDLLTGDTSFLGWNCHLTYPWLVVCGDMLLMVGCKNYSSRTGAVFEAYYCLDTSTEPAKWVKVERLENWAIFISGALRVQPLSCRLNPERWGGRSNCVYRCDSGHMVAFELGKPLHGDDATNPDGFIFICTGSMVLPTWAVPSMFSFSLCCDGQ